VRDLLLAYRLKTPPARIHALHNSRSWNVWFCQADIALHKPHAINTFQHGTMSVIISCLRTFCITRLWRTAASENGDVWKFPKGKVIGNISSVYKWALSEWAAYSSSSSLDVILPHFSHDRLKSPFQSCSSATFQYLPGISDLLSKVPKFQHHAMHAPNVALH
jgi:hypothetical protein